MNHQFNLAQHAYEYVAQNPKYQVYSYPGSLTLCFNYDSISAKVLCNQLYQHEELMVGYGEFNGHTFVRLVFVNATNAETDIDAFFAKLEQFVAKHQTQLSAAELS